MCLLNAGDLQMLYPRVMNGWHTQGLDDFDGHEHAENAAVALSRTSHTFTLMIATLNTGTEAEVN